MCRESFRVAGAFDEALVAGVGQAVQGAVAEDRVVKKAEPFIHNPVTGDDEAERPMAVEYEFVETGELLGDNPAVARVFTGTPSGFIHRHGQLPQLSP